jgi:hypothetical protein
MVTLQDSTVRDNSAGYSSGIYNLAEAEGTASVIINSSTLSGNIITNPTPEFGDGCIYSITDGGTVAIDVNNSTISGNTGRAIFNDSITGKATLLLTNSTINGNSGIGVLNNAHPGATAMLDIANTILNSGPSGSCISNTGGLLISHGYNLSSDAAGGDNTTDPSGLLNGPGDIRNTNPLFGPLQNNGGPTLTHALLKNSPAINGGDPNFNAYSFNPPRFYDQRGPGFPRVVNGRLDIGAFESALR